MKTNSKMFKTLSQSEFSSLKFKMDRTYYYFTEGDETKDEDIKRIKEQRFENASNQKIFQLVDDDYEWNPRQDILYLDLKCSLDSANKLFLDDGICFPDAKLGLGLVWKADNSRIKRCIKIGEIQNSANKQEFVVNSIKLENISSNTDFRIIIYILKPGVNGNNLYLANEEGMIVYNETAWQIIINGSGSIFPIEEITDPNGPLWSYECSVTDVYEDLFNGDNLRILINKSHPSYKYIHPNSSDYNETFLFEIIASALTLIIADIKQSTGEKIPLEDEVSSGTVLQALEYFYDKLGFKINDENNELLKSIKVFFDKEM